MYLIEDVNGLQYKVKSLAEFCKEKEITLRLIRYTNPKWKDIEGKRYQEYHKGFKIISEDIEADEVENEEIKKDELELEKLKYKSVLVIGDLHAPFEHKDYLKFCKDMYKKYNCNKVVFIGDIIDNHYSSYHESDPDGFGGGAELELAKKSIAEFHREFPNSLVCIGNHDLIPNRKAFSNGLSNQWIKSIGEVVNTPTWTYSDGFMIDGVKYTHGLGRKARQRSQQDMVSVVQGHYHSESYIENYVGEDGGRRFAMQIGSGINIKEYAFAYGRHFAKPHVNVGIVINGKLPIIEFMDI